MPEVRRRTRTSSTRSTGRVTRPRDRDVDPEDDDDDVDATDEPARRPASRTTSRPKTRREEPEDDEEPDDDDDADEGDDDDEEPEEKPRARTSSRSGSKSRTTARRPKPEPEDDDDDADADDDEPASRRTSRSSSSRSSSSKEKVASGVRSGWEGAEAVRKQGGSGPNRLSITGEPELIKFLEAAPFANFKQHWVPQGKRQPDRPYTCPGTGCPLCKIGDVGSKAFCFNVLHLSTGGDPEPKMLQVAVKAFEALKEAATPRDADRPKIRVGYWAVTRSGKGQRSQTNFRPVKERDLEEDWSEIFEHFNFDELPDIIEEAKTQLLKPDFVRPSTIAQLQKVARLLSEEGGDDDDDDADDDD